MNHLLPLLKLENISKKYDNQIILNNINLSIFPQEIILLSGPSGVGKTTLLKIMTGLETYTTGNIYFKGQLIDPKNKFKSVRKEIGVVFQNYNLFHHITVLENIILAGKVVYKWSKEQCLQKAEQLLKYVDLEKHKNKMPIQLSGGQQQRVAIARTLFLEPQIILFDEPTSSLDPKTSQQVIELLKKIHSQNTTLFIVTHNAKIFNKTSQNVKSINLRDLENNITCDVSIRAN